MQEKVSLGTSVRYIKGVGPERCKLLSRLGLETLEDVFYFFPRRYEDRRPVKTPSQITGQDKECVRGLVMSRGLIRMRGGRSLFRVVVTDGRSMLFGAWFNQPYLNKVFLPKSTVILYGKAEKEGRHWQMTHPEYEIAPAETGGESVHSGRIAPVYPLTEDLGQKGLRQLLFQTLKNHAGLLKEPLSAAFRKKLNLKDAFFAFRQIHFPDDWKDREEAYRRLVFDEFFLMQTVVQMKKWEWGRENAGAVHASGRKTVRQFLESLEFELTAGQSRAIEELLADMEKARPMNRLIQGDVGSGKTVVAAAALVFTAANGYQGALMAPTEVLAQQHYFNLSRWLEPLGIRLAYLAQGISKEERGKILKSLSSGEIQILIGTHALIQPDLCFKKLGLAVVDEQHKFGVLQRATLRERSGGGIPHFLLMTATPIPRTLAFTLYGDLEISTIREVPAGRKAVKTFWVEEARRTEVYALLDDLLQKGRQGYVICPNIEDRQVSGKGAVTAHGDLSRIFAQRKVGLLHGRMKSPEKKKIMQDFKEGRIQLLVSTVVIEVGVDVPNAVILVVENAEKFGLAQLHQLRGRVGRGVEESLCILFSEAASEETAERLSAFEATKSGFDIAEKDLELRGAGDIVGEKQHGLPELRIGDFAKDISILMQARQEAIRVVESDPRLEAASNQPLKQAIARRFGSTNKKKVVASF